MIIFRTEVKYRLPIALYAPLRKALIPFTKKDPHTQEGRCTYPVHSIYYDSPLLQNYYGKVEGEEEREKFRIRFYEEGEFNREQPLWLELKQKRGPTIKKLRCQVTHGELDGILNNTHFNPKISSIMHSFNMTKQAPVVKISYLREALAGKFERDTRITFDSQIKGAYSPLFHTETTPGSKYLLSPLFFVLEIKTSDSVPSWLSHIIEHFSLDMDTFSKYTNGIEHCCVERKFKG